MIQQKYKQLYHNTVVLIREKYAFTVKSTAYELTPEIWSGNHLFYRNFLIKNLSSELLLTSNSNINVSIS